LTWSPPSLSGLHEAQFYIRTGFRTPQESNYLSQRKSEWLSGELDAVVRVI
jgi:hypothetical protein